MRLERVMWYNGDGETEEPSVSSVIAYVAWQNGVQDPNWEWDDLDEFYGQRRLK